MAGIGGIGNAAGDDEDGGWRCLKSYNYDPKRITPKCIYQNVVLLYVMFHFACTNAF